MSCIKVCDAQNKMKAKDNYPFEGEASLKTKEKF
jgi:hypothetical protein